MPVVAQCLGLVADNVIVTDNRDAQLRAQVSPPRPAGASGLRGWNLGRIPRKNRAVAELGRE
jgi:hypothetical protein